MDEIEVTPLRKSKCNVLWYEDGLEVRRWRCRTQLNSYGFKEEKTQCWYHNCPGRREEVGHEVVIIESTRSCENYGCSNKVASDRKKYCSDKCRKQKARVDYEARNPKRKRRR